ncbi:MAG: hypothetical protein QOI06_2730 [Nocardioidaceae bacterium]|jgi:hypothetical protein|nr:hypothetical protein [Nocardioidaceae bacterium]
MSYGRLGTIVLTKHRMTTCAVLAAYAAIGLGLQPLLMPSPASAITYQLTVTCKVPKTSPQRQLAPNWCLNYLPDETQTYTAHVKNGDGHPVAGVTVKWRDSDDQDAWFRVTNNPCVTGSHGKCSDELVDKNPHSAEKITVTATAGGTTAKGYLSFH